jgi:hypothetical protein
MPRCTLAVLIFSGAVCLARCGPAAEGPRPEGVRERFYRCWLEVERVEAGRSTKDPQHLLGHEFAPDVWYAWGRRGELAPGPGESGVRIDVTTEPKRLELIGGTYGLPRRDPVVQPGIFKFEGGNLVLALGPWTKERAFGPGADYPERPKEFRSTKENGVTVLVLKPCVKYDQD